MYAVPLATAQLVAALKEIGRQIRRPFRIALVVAHICSGFVVALVIGAFFSPHRPVVRRATRWWLNRLVSLLSLEKTVHGIPSDQPVLFVANHVSWLDIPVLGSLAPVHFLSKAEVASWPLIGPLATAAGTLYIRRGGGQVRERARQISAHIAGGRSILVFPEGTTTHGTDVRAFHTPLFTAAVSGGHAVQPVAIRYLDESGRPHGLVPFVDDDAFHTHLWRLLTLDRVRVEVEFLEPITPGNIDHRALAAVAHARIREAVTRTSQKSVMRQAAF